MDPPPPLYEIKQFIPSVKPGLHLIFKYDTFKLLKEELNFMPKIIWNNMI